MIPSYTSFPDQDGDGAGYQPQPATDAERAVFDGRAAAEPLDKRHDESDQATHEKSHIVMSRMVLCTVAPPHRLGRFLRRSGT